MNKAYLIKDGCKEDREACIDREEMHGKLGRSEKMIVERKMSSKCNK